MDSDSSTTKQSTFERLGNFSQHPGTSILWRFNRYTLRLGRLFKYPWRWMAMRTLHKHGCLEHIPPMPGEAIAPDCDDLLFLFQMVRRKRPACVLEFGSGFSTRVIAEGLKRNIAETQTHARLFSIEQDVRWAKQTEAYLGDNFPMAEVLHRPATESEYDGVPVWRFEDLPGIEADMIYLDGPVLVPGRAVAVDILDIEDQLSPTCTIVVDGRWENVDFLARHLAHPHTVKRRRLHGNTIIQFIAEKH